MPDADSSSPIIEHRRRALLLGNDTFKDNHLGQLIAPIHDTSKLASVLSDPDIGDYQTNTLNNIELKEVIREIETFFSDCSPDDLLLFYYSGHGIRDDHGRLFLATQDTDTQRLWSSAIPGNSIFEMMSDSYSKRQVIILDCCYSGAFPKNMLVKSKPNAEIYETFYGKGRNILTASNSIEFALDAENKKDSTQYSLFTKNLIEGLQSGEADKDGNGIITVNEIYDYVYQRVARLTNLQTPQFWTLGSEGEMVFAKNKKHLPKEFFKKSRQGLLLGEYRLSLDSSGRMTIPDKFSYLDGGVITIGSESNLMILPQEVFSVISEKVMEKELLDESAMRLRRLILAQTDLFHLDHRHRFSLPESLRKLARIEKDVILVGAGSYLEIWSPDEWEKQISLMMDVEENLSRFGKLEFVNSPHDQSLSSKIIP